MAYRDEREALRAQIKALEQENEALRAKVKRRQVEEKRGSWEEVERRMREAGRRALVPRLLVLAIIIGASVVQLAHGRGGSGWALLVLAPLVPVILWAIARGAIQCPNCGRTLAPRQQTMLIRTRTCPVCKQRFNI